MKKLVKTKDGKTVSNLTFCHSAKVWIGLIKIGNTNRSAMWSQDGTHINRNASNLNLSL
jgi:hypothetical protein